MEKEQPRNPPAFPNVNTHERSGMTLRDYFASKAIQSILINSNENIKDGTTDSHYSQLCFLAKEAYDVADAMLKQREL